MKKFVTLVSVATLAMSLAACRSPSSSSLAGSTNSSSSVTQSVPKQGQEVEFTKFLEQQKDPVIMFSFYGDETLSQPSFDDRPYQIIVIKDGERKIYFKPYIHGFQDDTMTEVVFDTLGDYSKMTDEEILSDLESAPLIKDYDEFLTEFRTFARESKEYNDKINALNLSSAERDKKLAEGPQAPTIPLVEAPFEWEITDIYADATGNTITGEVLDLTLSDKEEGAIEGSLNGREVWHMPKIDEDVSFDRSRYSAQIYDSIYRGFVDDSYEDYYVYHVIRTDATLLFDEEFYELP